MKVLAIANRKGGTGKTTTAHALGAGLVRRGYRVLYIDLDSQANLSHGLSADGSGLSAMDVLTGSASAEQAIQSGNLIPAKENLASADIVFTGPGKEYRLKEAIEPISQSFDYVIIDCPVALGILTVNALTAADGVIIPAQADIYSLQGIGQINDTIRAVKKYCNPGLQILGILLTRYTGRAVLSREIRATMEEAAAQLNTQLYSTAIRECVALREAQGRQEDIFTYSPRSNAAKDYDAFIDEVLHQLTK